MMKPDFGMCPIFFLFAADDFAAFFVAGRGGRSGNGASADVGDGPPRRIGGGPARAAAVELAGFIDERIVAAARRTERRGEPFAAVALPRFAIGVFVEGVEGSRGDAARFCAIAG